MITLDLTACCVTAVLLPCSYERVAEGEPRVIVVVNAARGNWQGGEYGLWVGGGGSFKQIYCSQVTGSALRNSVRMRADAV
jgi:hypothetical protein